MGMFFAQKTIFFDKFLILTFTTLKKKEKTIIFANKNETLYRHNIHGIMNGSEPYKKSDNQTLPATRMNVSNEVCTRVF